MKRVGMVVKVQPEKYDLYVQLHRDVWPDVAQMIQACNIRNYSIYHNDGCLFSYFEYVGSDFEADMAKMAADPVTQEWWALCVSCLRPSETATDGVWWSNMEEIFHQN
ncbi:MAG: L-rhamnose mutarotase [Armatimonadota bacterium]